MSSPGEILEWFRAHKVQISAAIKGLYPFLHGLRDKKIISEEQFKNWCDQVSSNPNALCKVIYDVLESMKHNVSAVGEIFCKENLEEYKDLQPIYQSLENVLQPATKSPAAGPGKSNILQTKMDMTDFFEQEGSPLLLAPKFAQDMAELDKKIHFSEGEASTSCEVLQPATKSPAAGPGKSNILQTKMDMTDFFEQEGSPLLLAPKFAQDMAELDKKIHFSEGEASTSCEGKGIQNKKKQKLTVTCGKAKGFLFKEKLAAGVSQKSIKGLKGTWFTPQEFLTEGGFGGSNWRRSIRCNGTTLETLIKNGVLPEPPRASLGKKKSTNDGKCGVCMEDGSHMCCSSCNKSFHHSCHVPEEFAVKRPWKCTFCKWKSSIYCKEDKVLKQKMAAKQKLTCEYLLLKIWCESKCAVSADEPVTIQTSDSRPNNPMWLKRIKEKLHTNQYETVGDFIGDMGLMFSNFQVSNKDQDVAEEGKRLQNKFEKSFREAFFICK